MLVKKCITLATQHLNEEDGIAAQAMDMEKAFATPSEHQIDAVYWCRLAAWTPEEAACLAVGYDPDDLALIDRADAETYDLYVRLRRAAERYLAYAEDRAPARLAGHLARFGAKFPKSISRRLKKEDRYYISWRKKYFALKNSQIDDAEHKTSYLKLIYPYVAKKFKYEKGHGTNAVGKIKKDLEDNHNLRLSEKPIRNILNAACDLANGPKNQEKT